MPVVLEMYGTRGAFSVTFVFTHAVSASRTGSSIRLWKACVVCSARNGISASSSSAPSAASASSGPATTVTSGPLTAAMSSPRAAKPYFPSPFGDSDTAAIPPPGCAPMSLARCATSASASDSDSTPDRQAATYSPRL